MKITKEIANKLVDLFNNSDSNESHKISNGKDTFQLQLDKKEGKLYISLIKEDGKKKLTDFMYKIEDSVWENIMSLFDEYTGLSTKDVDNLFKQGRYNDVYLILHDAALQIIENTIHLYEDQLEKLK